MWIPFFPGCLSLLWSWAIFCFFLLFFLVLSPLKSINGGNDGEEKKDRTGEERKRRKPMEEGRRASRTEGGPTSLPLLPASSQEKQEINLSHPFFLSSRKEIIGRHDMTLSIFRSFVLSFCHSFVVLSSKSEEGRRKRGGRGKSRGLYFQRETEGIRFSSFSVSSFSLLLSPVSSFLSPSFPPTVDGWIDE